MNPGAMNSMVKQIGRAAIAAAAFLAVAGAQAESGLTVFESRMADGSVVLGDKPVAGAKSVNIRKYDPVPAQSRGVAQAEREYWRQQSEAFQRRQREGERPRGRGWGAAEADLGPADAWHAGGHVYYGPAAAPLVSLDRVNPHYTSSPGAVRGRDAGFIGSGFSTAR